MTHTIKTSKKIKGLIMLQQALQEYLKFEQFSFNINKSKVYKVIELSVIDRAEDNKIVKTFIIKYPNFNDFHNTLQKLEDINKNKFSALVLRKMKKMTSKEYILEVFEKDTSLNKIKYIKERDLNRYIKSKTTILNLKDKLEIVNRMYNVLTRGTSSVNGFSKRDYLSTCENINLDYFLNDFPSETNNEELINSLNNSELSNVNKLEIIKKYIEIEIK